MPSDLQLANLLREFARTMVTDFPIQSILDHLVKRIVDILPITAAGVTLISAETDPRYVAASDETALRYEELQTELGEGPCLLTYKTGLAVSVPNLRDESRFPLFTAQALEAGLQAVFTFPLHHDDIRLGALDLYRDTPGSLDPSEMAAAQTLADVAAAYLINADARADLRDSSDLSRETALHDALTGLPNRVLLLERLDHSVLRCRRSGKMTAVLFADLDDFKQVNDLYGHSTGDDLLRSVGARLTSVLRPGDTLARIAGDEFVILCEDLEHPAEIDAIAARIVASFDQPFLLSGIQVEMSASVGIAYSGNGESLPDQLLQDADTAMYQAKRKGGSRHQVIDLREQHLAAIRVNLLRDLRGATGRGELAADYQPIVSTATGRLAGMETLLRWNHPHRGQVSPSVLVPLAEQSGRINEIGRWIFEHACLAHRRWSGASGDVLTLAVNVSAHQLMSPDFNEVVGDIMDKTRADPSLVTIEVTESVFVQDSQRALVVLDELKAIGFNLALDDFGTGYSSLSYLKSFPIDIVKIDQAFIGDIEHDPASQAIVVSVVELAHALGMSVIAEGVETGSQRRKLASVGCDQSQGYFFSRPMHEAQVDALFHEGESNGAIHFPLHAPSFDPKILTR